MGFIKSCNMLLGKILDSKKNKIVPAKEVEENRNFFEAFADKQKESDFLKDGIDSKNVKDIVKDGIKSVNSNIFKTEFDYLVENDYAPVKYWIKDLKRNIQTSATQAMDSINSDLHYRFENDKGKVTNKMIDTDRLMDISLYINSSNNIAMYQHMKDGIRDYDGIYFQNDFVELLNDGTIENPFRDKLQKMYNDFYQDTVEFETNRIKELTGKSELGKRELKNIDKKADKEAINYTYIEGFLKDYNKLLKDKVMTDYQTKQVYSKIMESRANITVDTSDAMRNAGRNIDNMFIFSPEQYYRAVFKDLKSNEKNNRKNIFNIELKTTERKGTRKSPNTNFGVSELAYRTLMIQEKTKADFVNHIRSTKSYNHSKELIDNTTSAINNTLNQFSEKVNESNLKPGEQIMLLTYAKKFNSLIGSRYPDLKLLDIGDLSEINKYVINGVSKEGNVFDQLRDYMDVAVNNEKIIIKNDILQGNYDELFEIYPQFKYLKEGEFDDRDLIMMSNFFAKNENKKFNPTKFSKFRELSHGLRNSTLSWMNFDFKEDILIPNTYDAEGKRRVMVNDMGTTLRTTDNSNIERTLESLAQDSELSDDAKEDMKREYQELLEKNREELAKDYEGGTIEETSFLEDEASLLALDFLETKYLPETFGNTMYYADAKNATALTNQEMQKIFLSDTYSKSDEAELENKIRNSNSLIQDVLDGNVPFLDANIAKALGDIQHQMKNEEQHKDTNAMKYAKQVTRASKFGLLYNPFKFPKFSTNNAIGDFSLTMYNRPKVALKALNPIKFVKYMRKFYQKGDATFTQDEQYFLDNSQSFQRLNYNELLGTLDEQSKRETVKMQKEMENAGKTKLGIPKQMMNMKNIFGKYAKTVTKLSEAREMYLRLEVYNEVLGEIRTNGEVKDYGTVHKKAVKGITDLANRQEDANKKDELYKQGALVFANQGLIMYDDLSKFSDNMSTFGMPFIRYAEGNARGHFRMFSNLYHEYREAIKANNYTQIGKTTAKLVRNSAFAMAMPIAIWNAINMAIMGLDEEDIPEYAKENGYFMMGNAYLTNTDVFSDFASNVGFNNLRRSLVTNVKDKGLANGIMSGISESFNARQSIANRIANYASPLLKAPFEYITAIDLYPDGQSYVGSKYNQSENAIRKSMQVLGLNREFEIAYNALNKDSKMYKKPLEYFGFKISGDAMNEYTLARSNAVEYGIDVLDKTRRTGVGYNGDIKQTLRFNISQAIKNQDDDFAMKLFNEYVGYISEISTSEEQFNKEIQSLKQSLKSSFDIIPSSSIPKDNLEDYILSLNDGEFDRLQSAQLNQQELLGPYYDFIYG